MKLTLTKPELFAAAARFTSTEKMRDYLSGISVERREAGGVFIVSTDGHRAFVALDLDAEMNQDKAVILPPKRKMGKNWFKSSGYRIALFSDDTVSLEGDAGTLDMAVAKDMTDQWEFPNVRRIIPSTFSGEAASFNASYLKDFQDVFRLLTGSKTANLHVTHNGNNDPAYVALPYYPHAFGILMPFREKKDTDHSNETYQEFTA
jgi:DNA polymerase III sliding clamp (beta) subunit (PCNA family)